MNTPWLSPSEISQIFKQEIARIGGTVTESNLSPEFLFARSILPPTIQVAPHDRIRGGTALRASENEIGIHPCTYRLVCSNGAIHATCEQSRVISRENWFTQPDTTGDLATDVAAAIRACASVDAFERNADQMSGSRQHVINILLNLSSLIGTRSGLPREIVLQLIQHIEQAEDRSAFGVMNAITSFARDTRDPQTKWRLEELGGAVLAMPRTPARSPGAARLQPA